MGIPKKAVEEIKVPWRIDEWFPEIPEAARVKLRSFHRELIQATDSLGLIHPKTIENSDALHFADSILACRIINQDLKGNDLYDFGSGGGLPGLIFAVLFPTRQVFLVEVDPRKAEFLKQMISTLKIPNVRLIVGQVESLPVDSVGAAVCRGFLPLSRALLATRKIFKTNGSFYHLKGNEWSGEISSLPTQLCSHWQPGLLGKYTLPEFEGSRVHIVVIKTEKV